MNTSGATSTIDPRPACATTASNGVWFTFIPSADGVVTISTCGSDFDTALQVYTGNCNSLTNLSEGCNNNDGPACSGSQASVRFYGTSNTVYRILAAGVAGRTGNLRIVANLDTPLPNDPCAGAIPLLPGQPYLINTSLATSTADPRPTCVTTASNGVWFTFIPSADGVVTISTCGSDFDTALQVYTGDCNSLTTLTDGCNNDNGPACSGSQASVRFYGTSNTIYRILAAGVAGRTGNLRIVANLDTPLPNDLCAGAIPLLPGQPYLINTSLATSTADPRPTCATTASNGVWFTFIPSADGVVTISTCGSDFDTALQVYTGDCNSLTTLTDGCNNDNGPACATVQGSVWFYGTSNTIYRILAAGVAGRTGNLRIVANLDTPLPNDLCAGAIPLLPGQPYSVNISGATSIADPRPTCATTASNGVWFTFIPSVDGVVTISTCGSDFDTALQVYTGNCNSLTNLSEGCNNNDGPACSGSQASVRFYGTSNTLYRILAAGVGGRTGNLHILATLDPPLPNDFCSGAIPLQLGQPYTMNTSLATSTADPRPTCATTASNGVWFTFTPSADGVVIISTCGSDFDTALQVYTGGCTSLAAVSEGCNNNDGPACSGSQASVRFYGTSNTVYRILAAGVGGRTGNLRILAAMEEAPPNDLCSGAIPLLAGQPYTMNTSLATSTGDPRPTCATTASNGVWFTFIPSADGVITISTCGSDFDTALQVYTGDCNPLTTLTDGCNNDNGPACSSPQASIRFYGFSNTVYRILAAGVGGRTGNLRIVATLDSPLPNDLCAGAIPLLAGQPYTMNTSLATSTGDPRPTCATTASNGVWFTFIPSADGVITISTCGSDFDTALQVYTGNCNSLTNLTDGCNNDNGPACTNTQASVRFYGFSNTVYRILVAGVGGRTGNLRIVATLDSPLPNDLCAGAIPLLAGQPYTMNTSGATSTIDPRPTCATTASNGVWFTFVPSTDGWVTISTCGSDYDTALQVYTGGCTSLAAVSEGCNNNDGPACIGSQASVRFFGTSNTIYRILVAGVGGRTGNLRIVATFQEGLANDLCSGAIPLLLAHPYTMNTAKATSFTDPVPVCATNAGNGVWFSFRPHANGWVVVSTCGSDFDTVVQVYTGSCNQPTSVGNGCNNDNGPACSGSQASTRFYGTANTEYRILVAGASGQTGHLRIVAILDEAVPNDLCTGAIPLAPGQPYAMNTAGATSTADPTPVCRENSGSGVWFTFTPPTDGWVTVSTCGSDFDTVLQVYIGDCIALTPIAGGCNDDQGPACGTAQASVRFFGTSNTQYRILAAGYAGRTGNLQIEAVVVPDLRLNAALHGNQVVLSWPTGAVEMTLMSATNLGSPTVWRPVPPPYPVVGGRHSVTNLLRHQTEFFRLQRTETNLP